MEAMPQIIDALINVGIILGILLVLYYALVFFWFQEKASESLLSDVFFTVALLAIAYFISARRTDVAGNLWSAFVVFCIATALKLIYQAITRRLEKRFSKVREKYAIIKRKRKLARFKNSHFFHLRVKKRHQPIRKPYKP